MIASRRARPLARLLALAVLVIHVLAAGSYGFIHASERWTTDVSIGDPDAGGSTSLHDSLCCPSCHMGCPLPVPAPSRAAELRALLAGALPSAKIAPPPTRHLHSASPRAPPALAA